MGRPSGGRGIWEKGSPLKLFPPGRGFPLSFFEARE
ncbi:hypothetical protein TNMX_03135 [Thermus sp. NMX2.A1]|nr:hypothetical protein TNMX_03135 [Thermus sp. NMX2.A1]